VTAIESVNLKTIHDHIAKIQAEPKVAKAHGMDSVKQRTDLAKDVRLAMGATTMRRAGGGDKDDRDL